MPGDVRYTVVYDGACRVCRSSVDALERWDRNKVLEIIPSQGSGVAARFPWIAQSAFADSIQLIRASDNKTWQGAAAVEELLKTLPKGKRFAWMFSIPFARPIAERFYRWFARNRNLFGCGDHCSA